MLPTIYDDYEYKTLRCHLWSYNVIALIPS